MKTQNTTQTKPAKTVTREAWLNQALEKLRPWFEDRAGVAIPQDARVSVGFPGGGSARKRIGECWARSQSKDKVNEIFISPVLSDPIRMLDVLVHEAVHAVDDCQSGHKEAFKRTALAVGLEGKMTATHAGDKLKAELERIIKILPPLTHGALDLSTRKKQPTRLVKLECDGCGMIIRTTAKWIEQTGNPDCACGGHFGA
jgi:hypothetical protein